MNKTRILLLSVKSMFLLEWLRFTDKLFYVDIAYVVLDTPLGHLSLEVPPLTCRQVRNTFIRLHQFFRPVRQVREREYGESATYLPCF